MLEGEAQRRHRDSTLSSCAIEGNLSHTTQREIIYNFHIALFFRAFVDAKIAASVAADVACTYDAVAVVSQAV
jgi:hypothetical protein